MSMWTAVKQDGGHRFWSLEFGIVSVRNPQQTPELDAQIRKRRDRERKKERNRERKEERKTRKSQFFDTTFFLNVNACHCSVGARGTSQSIVLHCGFLSHKRNKNSHCGLAHEPHSRQGK